MNRLKEIFSRDRERMNRTVKWFFGLPLFWVFYLTSSIILPVFPNVFINNIIRHIVLVLCLLGVVKLFLGFDIKSFFSQQGKFNFKKLFASFAIMLLSGLVSYIPLFALHRQDFEYTFNVNLLLNWLESFVLIVISALYEELLFRSYIAHFFKDNVETDNKKKIYYCLVSALVFSIAHFGNPEVSVSELYSYLFYFIEGFALMAFFLETKGLEAPLGIHIANNILCAWFVSYDSAVIKTNALFTQHNNMGFSMLIQTVICLCICAIWVHKHK